MSWGRVSNLPTPPGQVGNLPPQVVFSQSIAGVFSMANYRVDDIRTVALVGHEVAGKTSLADALLFKAKAVERRGSVDDGSSMSDFDEEEKKHKYSIDSALMHVDYQGKRIYLIDTPGKPEF